MPDHLYESAIIGAGPIGLELAVAMKKAGVDYVHFDARQIAYTISWYAPQTRFFSSNERIAIAGVPLVTPEQAKATREQYLAYLRAVVEQFELDIHTYEPVVDLHRSEEGFELITQPTGGQRSWRTRSIILATGGTDRPRLLGVPGENLPHVSHYFDDPHKYFRQNLLIVGGRNSAVEAALRCHHAGAKVVFSYRRARLVEESIKYWLMPEFRSLLSTGRVRSYLPSHVQEITPSHVLLKLEDGGVTRVPADFVLLLTGYEQDSTLFRAAGIELVGTSQAPRFDPATMQTNVPGIYVAGTAIGGTQERFSVFIENCHDHITKIMNHRFDVRAKPTQVQIDVPES